MPFGLVAAPATFQRCMNNALQGLDQSKVFCYLDDILVATKMVEDHLATLGAVLTRLTENSMKLKPSKCKFLCTQTEYLGYQISQSGVKPHPRNQEAIAKFPVPKRVKDV